MNRLRIGRTSAICATIIAVTLLLATAAAATGEEPTVLRGHVLLPDGKPAAGAGIYWAQFKAPPPRKLEDVVFEKRTVADDAGRFELTLTGQDAPLGQQPRPLIAYLRGHGIDWVEIAQDDVPQDVMLRLVTDHPIRGRVTDTEGRRVAGAKITVSKIAVPPNGKLDDFLAAWIKGWRRNPDNRFDRQLYASRFVPFFTTTTDQEGRFELSGVGNDRLASVNIVAPGIVSDQLEVVNREGFDAEKYNQAAQAEMLPQMRMPGMFTRLTSPVFDHVAETELVIRGKVFTGPDRKPVRALVSASGGGMNFGGGTNPISVQTDEAGRFELRGLRRTQSALLSVHAPRESNLLFHALKFDLAPGQTVVDTDVELREGVVVEGRVFDKVTGRGVRSGVQFLPIAGNEYANQPGYDRGKNMGVAPQPTDDEGHFRILVMPGPGVLMAQVQSVGPPMGGPRFGGLPFGERKPIPYRQASFNDEDSKRVNLVVDGDDRHFASAYNRVHRLTREHAVKVIDVPRGGEAATCDLPLDPGKTATIEIEDEQGSPVADVIVGGVADTWPIAFKNAEPTCTIYGLGADRPRHVCVVQRERHLAGSVTLTGDEAGLVKVRLVAAASISGRALDPNGEPLAEAFVQMIYARRNAWEMVGLAERDQAPRKTDADGRFRVENVLLGERLSLQFKQGDKFFGGPQITSEKRQLAPGEQLDLGDFKVKQ